METERGIQIFTRDYLRLRQFIQEGKRLTDEEYRLMKSYLETLLNDLERNFKRGRQR